MRSIRTLATFQTFKQNQVHGAQSLSSQANHPQMMLGSVLLDKLMSLACRFRGSMLRVRHHPC